MAKRIAELPEYEVHESVAIDPKRTAILIVDMQNDFCKPEGKLYVPDAPASIPAIVRLLTLARGAQMKLDGVDQAGSAPQMS